MTVFDRQWKKGCFVPGRQSASIGARASALCCSVHIVLFLVPVSIVTSDWITINLSLLTTAVKDKKMQGSLTLVVFLNIGESHIPSLRGFFRVIFLDVLLLSFFDLFCQAIVWQLHIWNWLVRFLFFCHTRGFQSLRFCRHYTRHLWQLDHKAELFSQKRNFYLFIFFPGADFELQTRCLIQRLKVEIKVTAYDSLRAHMQLRPWPFENLWAFLLLKKKHFDAYFRKTQRSIEVWIQIILSSGTRPPQIAHLSWALSLLLPYIFRNQRLVKDKNKTCRVFPFKQLDLTAGEYFNPVELPAWRVSLGARRARVLASRSRTVTLHLEAAFPSAPSAPINDRNGPRLINTRLRCRLLKSSTVFMRRPPAFWIINDVPTSCGAMML